MPYAGYCSFTQSEACFQRGQESKPFTIAMECEVMPREVDNLTLPLARKGLAGEPVGLVCRSNNNNPIAWARVRFKNFSTSNIVAFYTSFLTTPPVTLGQKHLLIMTYCGDKFGGATCFKFYINGVSVPFIAEGTMTADHEFENETSVLTIGGTNGHPNAVSRMTMWKRELTETEIALGSGLFNLHESDKIVDAIASEGNGSIIYNALGSNHGTLTNVTLATVWGTPLDTLTAWNQLKGFSLYHSDTDPTLFIRIPYKNDGTPNHQTITGYSFISDNPAGRWFNGAESLFKLADTTTDSDLFNSDPDRFLFEADGTAKWFSINNIYSDNTNAGYLFVRWLSDTKKDCLVIYKTDKTAERDIKVLKFMRMEDYFTYDEDGAIILNDDEHVILFIEE